MREYLHISGSSHPLHGHVRVSGAKNSALPLLMATLLTDQVCQLDNVPDLEDIVVTIRLLRSLGAEVDYTGGRIRTRTPNITATTAPYGAVKAMRASFWVLGPILARAGKAQVALPGGDAIGTRPVDLHLKALSQMGAEVEMKHGVVVAHAPGGLSPQRIVLAYPSVGATHHILLTAALVPGETVIDGAAREPEIVDLGQFLTAMGAPVEGAGTSRIVIHGSNSLLGARHTVIGDRIEAATYLTAAAMTQGDVTVHDLLPHNSTLSVAEVLGSVTEFLAQCGAKIEYGPNTIRVSCSSRLKATSFSTAPFPGIATDVQPLLMAAMATAEGSSVVTETVFEGRFSHVAEFRRLGAEIKVQGQSAVISGGAQLSGAPVEATDIRAAAGLVLLGLVAQGETELHELYHLDRGYELLVEKFSSLGARLSRVPLQDQRELVVGC